MRPSTARCLAQSRIIEGGLLCIKGRVAPDRAEVFTAGCRRFAGQGVDVGGAVTAHDFENDFLSLTVFNPAFYDFDLIQVTSIRVGVAGCGDHEARGSRTIRAGAKSTAHRNAKCVALRGEFGVITETRLEIPTAKEAKFRSRATRGVSLSLIHGGIDRISRVFFRPNDG